MRYLFALIFGAALGVSSVFLYSLYPPVGLVFSIAASAMGVWAAGRFWGKRIYKVVAATAWGLVVLRAGFPGINDEYLLQGNTTGISLINFGFIAIVIAVLAPL
jgi:hypothetical protein